MKKIWVVIVIVSVVLAVQEFGTPLSAYPAVDEQLKVTIDSNEQEIKQRFLNR